MRKTVLMLFLSTAGALLNIVSNKLFTSVLGFPLYMDTMFTITITLVFGLFWGVFCGTLTNIILHSIGFWGWEGYLFVLCNAATALITWLFIKLFPRELNLYNTDQKMIPFYSHRTGTIRIIMDRTIVLILTSFGLCLVISILGGAIASFILIFSSSYTEADIPVISCGFSGTMFDKNYPVFLSQIFSRIPVNIVDRLISVFAGYGAAYLLRSVFKLSSQRPKPSSSTLPEGSM